MALTLSPGFSLGEIVSLSEIHMVAGRMGPSFASEDNFKAPNSICRPIDFVTPRISVFQTSPLPECPGCLEE